MGSREDTIVAVSSPPGRGWRGIVRLSGPAVRDIAAALCEADGLAPRQVVRVMLHDPPIPVLAICFAGPASYTGQDALELQAPGHPALLERLVRRALDAGARLAEPGEFTFRAFLAGKLDLTQAEGVAATISAVSDGQLRAAAQLRSGRLANLATDLVDALGTRLALVEAGIDFTDQEDVVPIGAGELDAALAEAEQRLATLLERSRSWGQVEALPRVVLVGPPSSGKSTLFNALLGRTRAVISAMPGTTRDVLAEPVTLCDRGGRGVEVMLVDMAGLDTPAALLDAAAQQAARDAIARADLLLCIGSVNAPSAGSQTPTLSIRTKADRHDTGEPLHVSAATGLRMNALRAAIVDALGGAAASSTGEALALQPRHEHDLRRALAAVRDARALLADQPDPHGLVDVELVAAALRQALDHLCALGGELTPDDVIGRVFATFCVGK